MDRDGLCRGLSNLKRWIRRRRDRCTCGRMKMVVALAAIRYEPSLISNEKLVLYRVRRGSEGTIIDDIASKRRQTTHRLRTFDVNGDMVMVTEQESEWQSGPEETFASTVPASRKLL